jgi:non-ribosomal peptide synthetase component F
LRVDILQEALRLLIKRHETLRTCFQEYDGVITQQISPVSAPDVVVNDVSDHVDPAREALRLTRQEAATPVELDKPPLIRGRVIMVGTDECLVVLTTHHIVGDGWSSKILVQELGILYQAVLAKTAPALAPLPITYKDYAWWQAGQDWSDAAAYWQEKLKGAPGQIALPTDRAAPDMQSYRGAHRHLEIEAGVLAGLHKLARAHNTTLSAVGLALFSAMLYRLTRQQDMVIGMGVAGRERTETEGLIGFFVNVLPIRVQLDDETNLGTLIDDLHGNITAALDRQDYPFDELVRAVAPKRNANRQPLVNVVFEYQRFGDISNQDEKGGLPLARQGQAGILPDNLDAFVDNMTAKHDVILFLVEEAGQARFTLEYDTDLFDAETMQRWLAFLGKFARAAVQDI